MTIDPNEAVAAILAIHEYELCFGRTLPTEVCVYQKPVFGQITGRDRTLISAVRDWCRKNNKPWPEVVAATEE